MCNCGKCAACLGAGPDPAVVMEFLSEQLAEAQAALAVIADDVCQWRPQNGGKECRSAVPGTDDGLPYNRENWCGICVAKATLWEP